MPTETTERIVEIAPEPKPLARGHWVLEPFTERFVGTTFVRTEVNLGANHGAAADLLARRAVYPMPTDLDERLTAAMASGERVTALVVRDGSSNGWGIPSASIYSGRVFPGQRGPGILPVGKRTNGFSLTGIVDLAEGRLSDPALEMHRRWYENTVLPPSAPLRLDDLASASDSHPAAVLWTHPGFGGGRVPGCVWIVTDVSRENDIADGYLWCPPSELVSEHGSIELSRLVREGALVSTPPRITFADCFNLPTETLEAYRAIFA